MNDDKEAKNKKNIFVSTFDCPLYGTFFFTSSLYGNGDAKRFYIDIRFLEQCHIVCRKKNRNTVSVSKRGGDAAGAAATVAD